jgi:hypothetical protein
MNQYNSHIELFGNGDIRKFFFSYHDFGYSRGSIDFSKYQELLYEISAWRQFRDCLYAVKNGVDPYSKMYNPVYPSEITLSYDKNDKCSPIFTFIDGNDDFRILFYRASTVLCRR